MLQDEGTSCEDAEQRVQQVSSDMQAIIGMQHSHPIPVTLLTMGSSLWVARRDITPGFEYIAVTLAGICKSCICCRSHLVRCSNTIEYLWPLHSLHNCDVSDYYGTSCSVACVHVGAYICTCLLVLAWRGLHILATARWDVALVTLPLSMWSL